MVDFRPAGSARSGRMPIPQRSRGGSDIARGIGQVGDALFNAEMQDRQLDERDRDVDHQLEMAELARKRQAEIADAAGRFAEVKGGLAIYSEELKVAPGAKPGAAGHAAAFAMEADKRLKEFAGTLSADPEVRTRFEPMIQSALTEFTTREKAWEIGETGKYQGEQWKKYANGKNIELQTGAIDKLFSAIEESTSLAEGMGFTGTQRVAILDATHREMAVSFIDARMASGQQAEIRALLKKGILDPFMTAEMKDKYYTEADRADERAAMTAARAQADAERVARETLGGVQKLLDSGAEPSPQEMKNAEAAAALLPPAQRVELAVMQTQLAINRETRGLGVDDIRHRRDFLRARVDAGKATQEQQLMLRAYDKRLEAAEDREADDTKLELGAGVQGRVAAVERLQARDPDTRFRVGEKAEAGLGFAATLPAASSRRMAIEGGDARKNRKDLFDEKLTKEMRTAFRSNMGSVATGLQGSEYSGREALAMDLYAADVVRNGRTGFDAKLFWQYQNIAFGATRRADGKFQGGLGTVNGRRVELPQEMSDVEFRSFVARSSFAAAVDDAGRAIPKSFITTRMTPQLDEVSADGRTYWYKMVGASGATLKDKDGRDLRLPVPLRGAGAP